MTISRRYIPRSTQIIIVFSENNGEVGPGFKCTSRLESERSEWAGKGRDLASRVLIFLPEVCEILEKRACEYLTKEGAKELVSLLKQWRTITDVLEDPRGNQVLRLSVPEDLQVDAKGSQPYMDSYEHEEYLQSLNPGAEESVSGHVLIDPTALLAGEGDRNVHGSLERLTALRVRSNNGPVQMFTETRLQRALVSYRISGYDFRTTGRSEDIKEVLLKTNKIFNLAPAKYSSRLICHERKLANTIWGLGHIPIDVLICGAASVNEESGDIGPQCMALDFLEAAERAGLVIQLRASRLKMVLGTELLYDDYAQPWIGKYDPSMIEVSTRFRVAEVLTPLKKCMPEHLAVEMALGILTCMTRLAPSSVGYQISRMDLVAGMLRLVESIEDCKVQKGKYLTINMVCDTNCEPGRTVISTSETEEMGLKIEIRDARLFCASGFSIGEGELQRDDTSKLSTEFSITADGPMEHYMKLRDQGLKNREAAYAAYWITAIQEAITSWHLLPDSEFVRHNRVLFENIETMRRKEVRTAVSRVLGVEGPGFLRAIDDVIKSSVYFPFERQTNLFHSGNGLSTETDLDPFGRSQVRSIQPDIRDSIFCRDSAGHPVKISIAGSELELRDMLDVVLSPFEWLSGSAILGCQLAWHREIACNSSNIIANAVMAGEFGLNAIYWLISHLEFGNLEVLEGSNTRYLSNPPRQDGVGLLIRSPLPGEVVKTLRWWQVNGQYVLMLGVGSEPKMLEEHSSSVGGFKRVTGCTEPFGDLTLTDDELIGVLRAPAVSIG